MVDNTRIRDFWSHWNHEPNPSEEFERFRVRMVEVSRKLWDDFFKGTPQKQRRERFALISGTPYSFNEYFPHSGLCQLLNNAKTPFEIAHAIQCLLWTAEGFPPGNFDHCCRQLEHALDISPPS